MELKPPDLVFTVEEDSWGVRLDVFLGQQCAGELSRSYFKKLIQDGRVLVNERTIKPGYELRPGDRVWVRLPAVDTEFQLRPQSMVLDVLFEDEDILVINKPPGVVVHPGAGQEEGTLVHGLLAHCPRLATQGAPRRPGIVHRLDKDTSGALVVAKTERAYLSLIDQFKEHKVRKEYLTLVYGSFASRSGEIRTLIDRHPVDRKKMAVVEGRGREAISRWQVEKDWGEVSLLRVLIETGRTHQIRVHLSHLRHPVVGDSIYGGGKRRVQSLKSNALQEMLSRVERQLLHAWRLSFEHPITRASLSLEAALPSDFGRILDRLRLIPSMP
jgi:23S rRNA pseudouridine1911/1915/1917 synthase